MWPLHEILQSLVTTTYPQPHDKITALIVNKGAMSKKKGYLKKKNAMLLSDKFDMLNNNVVPADDKSK